MVTCLFNVKVVEAEEFHLHAVSQEQRMEGEQPPWHPAVGSSSPSEGQAAQSAALLAWLELVEAYLQIGAGALEGSRG